MSDWFPVFVKLDGLGQILTGAAILFLFFSMLATLIEGHEKLEHTNNTEAKGMFLLAWGQFGLTIGLGLFGIWWTMKVLIAALVGFVVLSVAFLLLSSIKAFLPKRVEQSSSSSTAKSKISK